MKDHVLGTRSRNNLNGVKPEIIAVIYLALKFSEIDFAVVSGVRSISEQRFYFNAGTSKTMNSFHLLQDDGFGHAVDLMPTGFKVWKDITPGAWLKVKKAVKKASEILDYSLYNGFDMWGWDKPHWQDKK